MSTLVHSPTLGLEQVARQTLIYLIDNLNAAIAQQEIAFADDDLELWLKRGGSEQSFEQISLEPVDLQNFHLGHRPSLIQAPVEGYPNVSTFVESSRAAEDDSEMDQMSSNVMSLVIEIMVKSLNGEEETNRRVQRMTDAVNICMMSNRTLSGLVYEIGAQPSIGISDLFVRKGEVAYGNEWFWQGARFEYSVVKEAAMPKGSSFLSTVGRSTNLGVVGIDQS